ncbi:MAG: type II toxin-antitoxin system HicA family toxin [Ruminococcus sp.]|jgi:predicted RNA binding protein YcfA (HicA-like mRNA interferase family)|nr:type II toxin-antitoxin system HicA family toxin [Ruminococcus sp.]
MRGKDLIKRLKKDGWVHVRTKGSHFVMMKDGVAVAVPVHNTDLPPGTLHSIMKQTGLKEL